MSDATRNAPSNPVGPAPLRRPASLRRTTSIDTDWPDGVGRPMRMRGRARDLVTPAGGGEGRVAADDWTEILASPMREIMGIKAIRHAEALQEMVGLRAGGHLRGVIARLLPEEHARTTAMHLLLDDFSGASLVAGWAWSRWETDWMDRVREEAAATGGEAPAVRKMEGICAGFAPGAPSLNPDGTAIRGQSATVVRPLPNPEDPQSWHPLAAQEGVGMRRARRLDVWFEDGQVRMDVGFQDSATSPKGAQERIAVHEYQVSASADPETFELLSIEVDPRILPYSSCPSASPRARVMEGVDLRGFRLDVLDKLPGAKGCTHLNDVLRSMADAPNLARSLREALA
jgi:hypothetical protein